MRGEKKMCKGMREGVKVSQEEQSLQQTGTKYK